MKHWLLTALIGLCFFSCKKEMVLSVERSAITDNAFFKKVCSQLRDSLSVNDYAGIDKNRLFRSKDAQSDGCFVRIAFLKKDIANDFILLKTDRLGNIRQGKIIHVNKIIEKGSEKSLLFQGQLVISALGRNGEVKVEIVNGKFKQTVGTNSLMAEEPAGEQNLPDVVVTSYSSDGSYTGDWYWYNGFYNDYGGGGTYTYGYSGGGGSGYNNSNENNDNTINIEVESNDEEPIKVEDYVKCFSTVPDANATYKITLLSDIPVNGDPSKIFDWSTNSPGHSFIELNKSGSGQSIQQNFGFYPETGWKAPFNVNVDSKIVDNADHEYNASLSLTINSSQFQATLNKIQAISGNDYNITTWNCTDFALAIFNAASPQPLTIPKFAIPTSEYPMPTTVTVSNTPQGLYEEIQSLQSSHNISYGTTEIPGIAGYAGESHGSCN